MSAVASLDPGGHDLFLVLVNLILEGGVLAVDREGTNCLFERICDIATSSVVTTIIPSGFTVGGYKVYESFDFEGQNCQL